MKIFRAIVLIVFTITAAVYGFFYFYNRSRTDTTYPVISYMDDVLNVSVTDDIEAFLRDVRASDEKDGDLTGRVIIEQISNFIGKGVANITYAVVDNDNHVARMTRRIRYMDYEPPRFTFSKDMRFALGSNFNVLDIIGAIDTIDGDLSKKIKLTSSDLSVNLAGVYQMRAEVTNSKGDIRHLNFNVTMYEGSRNAPEIRLKDYLVYMNVGDAFSAISYIDKVVRGESVLEVLPRVDSNVNTSKAGNYQVDYHVTDENGIAAKASLIVVVEE